ncbi:unnamed protein product [Rotaria magnacalcarata]|uniref:C3H1-type domain-containing protein n=1 Tax=Rotaria magnacalcarata TaxID=392030 RepID=A0A816NVI9_9BILA|nr:unnamed protein product [Rotaria magnacalcarata]CAF2197097.1 unnamed protein product [Rotaria magnacalcarata]CAF3906724.1 unnamed protein product [Rotaria magnacalcarata]CAF3927462.1 unnamed protein product [Rotaria magnacalcarata]
MQKSNDDCYYFLTSSCAKGSTCSYRHNSAVLTCNTMCPDWLRGSCIDSACQLRHSAIQSPAINTAKSCYYENTHMGCLKLDCTFAHIRLRPTSRNSSTVRSSSTNLVNKDAIKSTTSASLPSIPTNIPTIAAVASTNGSIPSSQIDSSQSSIPKVEILLQSETLTTPLSNETTPCRTAIPTAGNEQIAIASRNVVTNSSEDTKSTTTQSRVVGNRNVVIADASNRKIVQATTNRVVVSSDTINAPKRIINNNDSDSDLDDLIEEDNNNIKKLNSVIDISFPCAAPSITNRFLTSNTSITPTNDTKPIRLNRDRLPAAKISISNSSSSTSTKGEKTSAGTELTQDDERRTSRIERFKNKSSPSPRSLVDTPSSVSARNFVTVSTNERKRQIPESSINNDPPLKRRSGQQENNNNNNNKHHHHHNTTTIGDLCLQPSNPRRISDRHRRRSSSSSSGSSSSSSPPSQRKSPPRVNYSTKLSMDDSAWKRQVDEFLAKTTQPKPFVPSIPISSQPVPLLSLRPRFIPPLLPHRPITPRYPSIPQRPRQPPKVSIQRPPPPVVNNLPPILSKPVEPTPIDKTSPIQPSTILNDEDENKLLELDEPTDVVDTFAFIDEALFETDDLVELM